MVPDTGMTQHPQSEKEKADSAQFKSGQNPASEMKIATPHEPPRGDYGKKRDIGQSPVTKKTPLWPVLAT